MLTADWLRNLPGGDNPAAVLETVQPEVIGDRFSAGGLNVASPTRFGAFLSSWTQTETRLGDISITDPRTGGTPMVLPNLPWWASMTTVAGAHGVDDSATGLSLTLEPLRPGTTWLRTIEGSASGPAFVANAAGPPPAVDSVQQWRDGGVLVSGPITPRVGVVAAGSWRDLVHAAAPDTALTSQGTGSGFAHFVIAATPRDVVRAIGWVQRATTSVSTDTSVHLQSTWERHEPARLGWRLFGGITRRHRSVSIASTPTVESLTSDPISSLLDEGPDTTTRWTAGARMTPPAARWLPTIGIDFEGARSTIEPTGVQSIRELVDGTPARTWTLQPGMGQDVRHFTTFALFANEHVAWKRLTLDAGVRLDTVSATAEAAARGIDWTTVLPQVLAQWHLTDVTNLDVMAGLRRSAYQLPLNVLAIGNPAASVADVSLPGGTPIARVGPGTGADPSFTQIDPQIARPTTRELLLAIRSRPRPGLLVQLSRITKQEHSLLGLFDTGVASSEYSTFQVADPSFLPGSPVGAPQVTVYNRPPASYGRDRYVLRNQIGEPAEFWGLDLSVRVSSPRFDLLAGTTLTWALGPAAAVGFLPTENDQNVLGSVFVDANDRTAARGQLFPDRSHVAKLAGMYRFPGRVTLGAIARYQDGQPFARVVVVPNLTQGTTAVRSFSNGGSAFTYTGTLDVRAQKVFTAGSAEIAAVVDVFNLPNLGNEVSEYIVSGPRYRTPTMMQPPLTVLAGVRATF